VRILIAVAHADDETLGCFSLLKGDDVWILHATDSTPLHPRYAEKAGYASVPEYRTARREEMFRALATGGVDPARWEALEIADQDAPRHVATIREAVLAYGADRIYTHAYEGGHPDHDALAFALRGLPNLWEFPLYRASATGEFETGGFLNGGGSSVEVADVESKRRMLACFASQVRVIERFPLDSEWFRPMKDYDFSKPPHEGPLYYEIRQHGWDWRSWRDAMVSEDILR
jgi:N-acetylglucosamine malate deacetylase 2